MIDFEKAKELKAGDTILRLGKWKYEIANILSIDEARQTVVFEFSDGNDSFEADNHDEQYTLPESEVAKDEDEDEDEVEADIDSLDFHIWRMAPEIEEVFKRFKSGDTIDVRSMMMSCDAGGMLSREHWPEFCYELVSLDKHFSFSDSYQQSYIDASRNGPKAVLDALKSDMLDNYVLAGLASVTLNIPRELPLVLWAASNKKAYPGLQGEISLMRFLLWAEYDPSAACEETGNTPLHLMCSLGWHPFTHPRAIGELIAHGADIHAVNGNGDTPLINLCGSMAWGPMQAEAFRLLEEAGSDLWAVAKDGSTALSILKQNNESHPIDARSELISRLEAELLLKETKPGKKSKRKSIDG